MRKPAPTENEMLLREIEEAEAALAETSAVIGCMCIIDPTETLGDRVRHLGMMAILMQVSLGQLRKFSEVKKHYTNITDINGSPLTYDELLRRLEDN